jgi:hypothetical protein
MPRGRLVVLLAAVPVLAIVLIVHGWVPGLVNDGPWDYLLEGDMRCMRGMGRDALSEWCNSYGIPLGYPFLTSGPFVVLGTGLMYVTGMASYPAYLIAGATFDAVALAGGYGLMRMLGTGRAVALGTAALYLIAPTTVGLHAFGGTFTGFALLPAYAFADVYAMKLFSRAGRNTLLVAACGYGLVKTGALLMDGYSFVAWGLLSALLWAWWAATESLPPRRKAAGVATMIAGHAVALGVYWLYTPEVVTSVPLDFFRSMGLDVTTLFQPTDRVWAADILGIFWDHGDLWGDGTNSTFNYVGIVAVALAFVAVATRFRERHVPALAVAGAIALVLSLGPSLKVDETRPPIEGVPTYESYLMPSGVAAADFPWGGVFTAVPGLEDMRAVYRWSGLWRLVLLVLAGLAVDRMWRRHRALAVVLALAAVIELLPNVPTLWSGWRDNHAERAALSDAVIGDLDDATSDYERAFFLGPTGQSADYLVNYLAPTVGIKAFNAGGDKNASLATASWPPEIQQLSAPDAGPAQVRAALAGGNVDVVIASYFDLRLAAYSWPPSAPERDAARKHFRPILSDPGFAVRRYTWFATIRARD